MFPITKEASCPSWDLEALFVLSLLSTPICGPRWGHLESPKARAGPDSYLYPQCLIFILHIVCVWLLHLGAWWGGTDSGFVPPREYALMKKKVEVHQEIHETKCFITDCDGCYGGGTGAWCVKTGNIAEPGTHGGFPEKGILELRSQE